MTAQDQLFEQMVRELSRRHAEYLKALGPVRVLALDPCPRCMSRVVASEIEARCTVCSWAYRESGVEPVASRKAVQ